MYTIRNSVEEEKRKETLEILEFELKKNETERKEAIEKLKEMEKLKNKDDRMLHDIMRFIRFKKSFKREIQNKIMKNMTKQEKKEKKMKKQKEIQEKQIMNQVQVVSNRRKEKRKIKKERKKMEEMRMKMAEDEPVYILCKPLPIDNKCSSMLWYVIEDNRNPPNDDAHFTQEAILDVVHVSSNDRIRSLPPPSPPPFLSGVFSSTIAVFNSYLYLLGGGDVVIGRNNIVSFTDFLHKEDGWFTGPPFPSTTPLTVVNTATSNNGSILLRTMDSSFNKQLLFLSSLSSTWQKLPEPSNVNLNYSSATILALTTTHIFCVMASNFKPTIYGVFFNLAEREWRVFDRGSFQGIWTQGVVFHDSYLVTYGTSTPYSFKKNYSLHVYDLKGRNWLPPHPCKYKNAFPPPKSNQKPFLFQVGPNKLAVIWVRVLSDSKFSELYCTKFLIRKTSGTNKPPVYAEVFSHGTYRVDGRLVSCVARNNVEVIDKGTSVKSRNEILELVAKDSWLSLL